jgi:hypothetical protein
MPAGRHAGAESQQRADLAAPGTRADLVLLGSPQHELAVARQVRARQLAEGAAPGQVAEAILAECAGSFGTTRIRACRLALGIALADVVAQVRARYLAEGRTAPKFSETLLSAYESGQKRPGPEYLHYLCATYRADPAELGFGGRCLCGQSHGNACGPGVADAAAKPHTSVVPLVPSQARRQPAGPASPHGDSDGDELRRTLVRLMARPAARLDGRFLGAVDGIRRRMDQALLTGSVSATLLDRWEQATAAYGRQYMTVPPQRLLCDVLLDFADMRRMCEQRQPLEFAERLCRLAGQLAGLAGMATLDLGDQRLARAFFRTARTATDEAGDRKLRAWVAVRESLVPLYFGDPKEAASLAGAAADLAGRQACAAAVMAPVIEARAAARCAELSGSRRRQALAGVKSAIDRAHDGLADPPAGQASDTAFGYTERQLFFHGGEALLSGADWRAAQQAFGLARQLYPAAEVLDATLVRLGQASCLLAAGEPEQALAVSLDTLRQLPAEHRSEITMRAGRALGAAAVARHPELPAGREYADALCALGDSRC